MSLILEALRKSEAERRRGQAPDLLTDAAPTATPARAMSRNRGMLVALGAGGLVVLLLVAWGLRERPTPEHAQPMPATDDTAVDAGPPVISVSPRPLEPAPLPRPAPAPLAPPGTAAAATVVEQPVAATPATPTASIEAPAPTPTPTTTTTPLTVAEPPTAPAPAFTSPDAPLRLADLASGERSQLPTLKVSMHMWSADPAQRFAIIDGARVNEGDRVGDATIEAIQQDGVMLAWRGRLIRLPLR